MAIIIKHKNDNRAGIDSETVRDMLHLNQKQYLRALIDGELTVRKDKTIRFGEVIQYCYKHNIKLDPVEFARRTNNPGRNIEIL